MASKNRDQLAGAQAKVSASDLKQQQKFRAISKADDASTTGQLINPVGAVIANPTGAGGQAGAQGGFGYGNPSYMNPNLRPQNVAGNQVVPLPSGPSFTANTNTRVKLGNGQIVSMPANTTMNFTQQPTMNVFQSAADVLMGRNTPGSMFYDNSGNSGVAVSRGNATMSTPGKGGNVNPSLVPVRQQQAYGGTAGYWGNYNQQNNQSWIEKFYGAVGGALKNFAEGTNNPSPVYPMYANSVRAQQTAAYQNEKDTATQAYLQGEKNYVPISAPELSRLEKERQAMNKPSYPYGTAGMYTYGQFSDKDQAFTQLLASGIPTTIPAAVADNLGLSQSLQDPGSGWKLQNGAWVNTGAQTQAMNPGNTDYTQTQFYRDYVSNEVPFEEQLRYDPKTGKYVRVGDWLKKKNDPRYTANASREAKQAQKRRQMFKMGRDEVQASYQSGVMEAPASFTGSWGVVSFNTGSG